MSKLIQPINLIFVALLAAPLSGIADSWSCRHINNVREIHIKRETDNPVPCSVVYKKLTEGVEDQVLWNAQNQEGYCEEKAKAFVAKQESWGWTCVETIATEASSGTEPPTQTTP